MRKHGSRWHPESCAPKQEILRLYQEEQLSTRQIAAVVGFSYSYIHKICSGVTRSMRDAAIIRQPAKSKHPRSSRAAARKKVERLIGRRLMRNEHVHHKDSDPTNNDIDNLEILSATDHHHTHKPANPVPRHLRPERKAYMKEYLRAYRERSTKKV